MDKGSEMTVFQRRYKKASKHMKKNAQPHQLSGNANHTYSEIPLHTHQDSYNEKDDNKCW